ncbi:molybdopterin oxidoreductase [Romboutsia weinsteinii]|uniref:Molybdopterin oxidoreductase n=1 Tax=Romboutsia weinsteinii TaxID=2020949 RepID=A0A371J8Y0_9FIRM|nr:molybdopterin-dependent oxidoreductase [Romboutsia weinsteinii]RDY29211.1 molybdopterin oxidoreductase [Romboutsia weinsteinii]
MDSDIKKLSHGCTLDCFDACKFNVYVDDNKNIIKIEGDKEHPYTKGIICSKGRAHLDRLNHENRIYTPLLKVDGKWIEISFEEAIDIMAKKLNYYKEEYSSKSVMYYEQYGNGSVLKSIGDIFFNFYGGASKQKGGPCWSAGIKAQTYDFGDVKGHALEDMLNSKSIFIWGKNPAYTTIHTMQILKKAQQKGSKVIVIDPICTSTAKIADKYIRIKPGTDGALAMAMAKIIIKEKLHDEEYINNYVLGFEEYKEYIDTLELDYLIEECGIDLDDIRELVNLYTDKYCTIHLGYGMQKYKNGGNTIRAIDALGAITGQVGFSGGGVNYANRVYPNILNSDPYKSLDYGNNREFYVSKISKFIKNPNDNCVGEGDNIPIKMAVVVKSNLLAQLPNLVELEDAFSKIEFKVCIDMFMTDTASACDLFIPATNTLESEDILYSSMTNPYITYNEKIVEPKNKLMDEYYFFAELAKVMGIKNYPIVDKREYLSKVIEPLKEFNEIISLEWIANNYFTIHKPVAWDDKKFDTPSGKYELYSRQVEYLGISPIPVYISGKKENKFRLLTNHHRDTLFSQHYMDKKGISQAYINKKMAINLNVENKEVVSLKCKQFNIDVEINIDDSVSDYVVKMYVGWWKKHGNPNFITDSGISDIGGQITYNETFVDIIKQK